MGVLAQQQYINELNYLSYQELMYLVNTQYQPNTYFLTADSLLYQSPPPPQVLPSEELPLGCIHVSICYFIWNQKSMSGVDPVLLAHQYRQRVLNVL